MSNIICRAGTIIAVIYLGGHCIQGAEVQSTILLRSEFGHNQVPANATLEFSAFAKITTPNPGDIGLGGFDLKLSATPRSAIGAIDSISFPSYQGNAIWPLAFAGNPFTDVLAAITPVEPADFQRNLGNGSPADESKLGVPLFDFRLTTGNPDVSTSLTLNLTPGNSAEGTRGISFLKDNAGLLEFRNAKPQDVIEHTPFTFTVLSAGDFNGDGQLDASDIDLLAAEVIRGDNDRFFDLNADNIVDQSDRKVWVEELKKTYFGDSNLDGEFGTTDLVRVFTVGEYEDGITGNSTWASGDWDGNADFDTRDFVFVFQRGEYEVGPRPAVAAVPEPSGLTLVIVAQAVVLGRRRLRTRDSIWEYEVA